MAGIIAARLGITGALGSQADVEDGVYTGRLDGGLLHGPAKATAVRDLAERHGFDLARCFAYSDSHNDLPLLSLVGHPCAVNPDAKLLRARRGAGLADPGLPHRRVGGEGRRARRGHARAPPPAR